VRTRLALHRLITSLNIYQHPSTSVPPSFRRPTSSDVFDMFRRIVFVGLLPLLHSSATPHHYGGSGCLLALLSILVSAHLKPYEKEVRGSCSTSCMGPLCFLFHTSSHPSSVLSSSLSSLHRHPQATNSLAECCYFIVFFCFFSVLTDTAVVRKDRITGEDSGTSRRDSRPRLT
jgi:hypothetical protein